MNQNISIIRLNFLYPEMFARFLMIVMSATASGQDKRKLNVVFKTLLVN